MLEYNKRHHMVTIIKETMKDSKQLFKALDCILGNKNENPLPTGITDSQPAEDFADFFLNKINKIREAFINIPAYQPKQINTPKLKKFTPITQSQLAKIIKVMPTKTCQLDVISTDKLKKVLEGSLPALTHIVNKSLETNQFYSEWKEALFKPLIKKNDSWPRKIKLQTGQQPKLYFKNSRKVYTHTTCQTQENKLLPAYQSAYRSNHSCETSLVKLVDGFL